MIEAGAQADALEERMRARHSLLSRPNICSGQHRDEDIFQHTALREQMMRLKDKSDLLISNRGQFVVSQSAQVATIKQNLSRTGSIQGPDNIQQSAFAA